MSTVHKAWQSEFELIIPLLLASPLLSVSTPVRQALGAPNDPTHLIPSCPAFHYGASGIPVSLLMGDWSARRPQLPDFAACPSLGFFSPPSVNFPSLEDGDTHVGDVAGNHTHIHCALNAVAHRPFTDEQTTLSHGLIAKNADLRCCEASHSHV